MEWLVDVAGTSLHEIAGVLRVAAEMPLPVDVRRIAHDLGIGIRSVECLTRATNGFLYRGPLRPEIVVNGRMPKVRQRFTIGHEICHWLANDPGLCFKLCGSSGREYEQQERRADRFAAELLLPVERVREQWEQCRSPMLMARRFNVSKASVLLRLYELELVSASGDSYLEEDVAGMGIW